MTRCFNTVNHIAQGRKMRSRFGTFWFVTCAWLLAIPTSFAQEQDNDRYPAMLDALASPIFFDSDNARDAHKDNVVMVRLEMARQRLNGMDAVNAELVSVKQTVTQLLDQCHWSMENLRRLDNSYPDIEGLASKTLKASPGLYTLSTEKDPQLSQDQKLALADLTVKVVGETFKAISNAYEASEERENYRNTYRKMREKAVEEFREIAGNRYTSPTAESSALSVDVSGSFDAYYNADWLVLKNTSGKDLTDCTLVVVLSGWHGADDVRAGDSHIHYVRTWPKDKEIIAPYPSTSHSGFARNESVDIIDTVDIKLYSKELTDEIHYQYSGENYDADLKAHWEKMSPSFYGKWYRYDTNIFLDDGFYCYYTGKGSVPIHQVSLVLPEGYEQFKWTLKKHSFGEGENYAQAFRDTSFNAAGAPRKVEIVLRFKHSDFTHSVSWDPVQVSN